MIPAQVSGINDLVTAMKNLVVACNTINQTVSKAFPSWSQGQIPGEPSNGNALAGNIGEYIFSSIPSGSAVGLTSATPANVTSISLTPGDWNVWGTVDFVAAGSTTATIFEGGINTVSATLPTPPGSGAYAQIGISVGAGGTEPAFFVGMTRISISSNTTVYLVAQSTFAVSTMSVFGFLGARRAR